MSCIFEEFPDKDWYWGNGGLSSNSGLTPQFILEHINEKWDMPTIINSSQIPEKFIETCIFNPWCWKNHFIYQSLVIKMI